MTTDQISEFLTEQDAERTIYEVVQNSGVSGIEDTELKKAFTAMEDLALSATLWKLWSDHQLRVGWDVDNQELKWKASA